MIFSILEKVYKLKRRLYAVNKYKKRLKILRIKKRDVKLLYHWENSITMFQKDIR